jgi:hypothetical protein
MSAGFPDLRRLCLALFCLAWAGAADAQFQADPNHLDVTRSNGETPFL